MPIKTLRPGFRDRSPTGVFPVSSGLGSPLKQSGSRGPHPASVMERAPNAIKKGERWALRFHGNESPPSTWPSPHRRALMPAGACAGLFKPRSISRQPRLSVLRVGLPPPSPPSLALRPVAGHYIGSAFFNPLALAARPSLLMQILHRELTSIGLPGPPVSRHGYRNESCFVLDRSASTHPPQRWISPPPSSTSPA